MAQSHRMFEDGLVMTAMRGASPHLTRIIFALRDEMVDTACAERQTLRQRRLR